MSRKSKIDPIVKVKIVEQYLDGEIGLGQASKNLGVAYQMIIPGLSEPPVRTLRATIPENESHIFR